MVKEVERLKKNREERRQRQAERKEEKEALMNLDPGNPNWEFLAMIRSVGRLSDTFLRVLHSLSLSLPPFCPLIQCRLSFGRSCYIVAFRIDKQSK